MYRGKKLAKKTAIVHYSQKLFNQVLIFTDNFLYYFSYKHAFNYVNQLLKITQWRHLGYSLMATHCRLKT